MARCSHPVIPVDQLLSQLTAAFSRTHTASFYNKLFVYETNLSIACKISKSHFDPTSYTLMLTVTRDACWLIPGIADPLEVQVALAAVFLIIRSSYMALQCFFKFWKRFVILPRMVTTLAKHVQHNTCSCHVSPCQNPMSKQPTNSFTGRCQRLPLLRPFSGQQQPFFIHSHLLTLYVKPVGTPL